MSQEAIKGWALIPLLFARRSAIGILRIIRRRVLKWSLGWTRGMYPFLTGTTDRDPLIIGCGTFVKNTTLISNSAERKDRTPGILLGKTWFREGLSRMYGKDRSF